MRWLTGRARGAIVCALGMIVAACGGGDGGSGSGTSAGPVAAASNVVSVEVNSGPNGNSANTLFTSVTVCIPGSTTQCQTIDNIQVDTGSTGLRILSSVMTLTLPLTAASDGNTLVECTQFVDGYSWGPVASADLTVSGETAASLPVQVIGDSRYPTVPSACAATGTSEDTVATFGANGILGVGVFKQDCGSYCVSNAASGYYYSCSATACTQSVASLASQVSNPVSSFTTDNNGTIISLSSVNSAGAATVSGSLIFGIDTQSNNKSGTQTVLNLDDTYGEFTTVFAGASLTTSFIDSGSNGYFFNDSSLSQCTDSNYTGFYCPTGTQSFSATLQGASGNSTSASFSVGNAQTLSTNNPSYTALPTLAGPYSSSTTTFDWGLNFFYGRRVANAIENETTSVGTGPYVAF